MNKNPMRTYNFKFSRKTILLVVLFTIGTSISYGQIWKVNNYTKNPKDCTLQDTIHYYLSNTQLVKVVYDENGRMYDLVMQEDPKLKLVVERRGEMIVYTHYNAKGDRHGISVLTKDGFIIDISCYENDLASKWYYGFRKGKFSELQDYVNGLPGQRALIFKSNGDIFIDTHNLFSGAWLNEM